jgi:hypothetical protein
MKTFKLENQPKIESGFKTPENYFDTFAARVLQQLPTKEPKRISIFYKRKTWLCAAAAILILGLSIPIYKQFNSHYSKIDDATLENYIAYQSSVSDSDLANLLEEEDIQKISIDLDIEDKTLENELADNKNLEYYLLN